MAIRRDGLFHEPTQHPASRLGPHAPSEDEEHAPLSSLGLYRIHALDGTLQLLEAALLGWFSGSLQ